MPEKSEGTVLWTSCSFLLHLSVSLLLLLCVLCHARQRQTIFNADSALTYLCWLYIVRMIIITRTDSYGIESPWPLASHPITTLNGAKWGQAHFVKDMTSTLRLSSCLYTDWLNFSQSIKTITTTTEAGFFLVLVLLLLIPHGKTNSW